MSPKPLGMTPPECSALKNTHTRLSLSRVSLLFWHHSCKIPCRILLIRCDIYKDNVSWWQLWIWYCRLWVAIAMYLSGPRHYRILTPRGHGSWGLGEVAVHDWPGHPRISQWPTVLSTWHHASFSIERPRALIPTQAKKADIGQGLNARWAPYRQRGRPTCQVLKLVDNN